MQQSEIKSASFIFKVIIIGDTSVGKSCLLLQFLDNRFRVKHQPTIGVQFGAKTLNVKNKYIKLQVWDTAGQQAFRSITRGYYRSAAAAILVYDITNKDSFKNLEQWLSQVQTSGNENMSYLLVANKCDLALQRKVSYQQGQKFATDNLMQFIQTSAKTGYNVQSIFLKISQSLFSRIESGNININSLPPGIRIGSNKHNFDQDNQQEKNDKIKCC